MKRLSNKAQIMQQLGGLGVGVATLVVVLAVVFLVLAETGSQAATLAGNTSLSTCGSAACNATRTLTEGAATIPDWVPLIILVVIGGIILGLVALFGGKR